MSAQKDRRDVKSCAAQNAQSSAFLDANRSAAVNLLLNLFEVPRLIWAFTESNFITFVLPNTAFGVLSTLAGSKLLQNEASSADLTFTPILWSAMLAMAFNWANVLVFDLQNQTGPESLAEDRANKPWRPIPSGQIESQHARRSMAIAIPFCLALNRALGVEREGLYIQIGSYVYNDLHGGDSQGRDVLIAIAFALFNTASLRIAAGAVRPGTLTLGSNETFLGASNSYAGSAQVSRTGYAWIGLISVVILTTMQVQDLKDQTGDRLRGRWTVPLAFGDWTSRVSLAVLVPFWTAFCAFVWYPREDLILLLPLVFLAIYFPFRVLTRRTPKEDSKTWKLWCLWGVGLYYLPCASSV